MPWWRGLDGVSIGEATAADEGGGDAGAGQEVLGFVFVGAVQAGEAVQSRHRALGHPAVSAKAIRAFDTAAGDLRDDAPVVQEPAQVGMVVALVGLQFAGRRRRGPRRKRTGGMLRTSGSSPSSSWVLAAEIPKQLGP
ncbi:hypothetical protein GCM10009527_073390 [Actinomadura nitritigenes]